MFFSFSSVFFLFFFYLHFSKRLRLTNEQPFVFLMIPRTRLHYLCILSGWKVHSQGNESIIIAEEREVKKKKEKIIKKTTEARTQINASHYSRASLIGPASARQWRPIKTSRQATFSLSLSLSLSLHFIHFFPPPVFVFHRRRH